VVITARPFWQVAWLLNYSILIAYVMLFTDVAQAEALQPMGYGTVSLADQLSRVLVILLVSAFSVMVIRRHIHLIHLSCLDPLTRLFNRNYLSMRAKSKIGKKDTAAVMLMDLDYFKNINDVEGHHSGEKVVELFAEKLQDMCWISDVICRYGGEEFLVIARDESGDSWLQRANQIRKLMAEAHFKVGRDNEDIRLKFIISVGSIPEDGENLDSIIKQADERLLAAKNQGRNRVYVAEYES